MGPTGSLGERVWELWCRAKAGTSRSERRPGRAPGGTERELRLLWPAAYDWAPATKWVENLRVGLSRLVDVHRAPIQQPYRHVVLLHAAVGAESGAIAIDYADRTDIDEHCAREVHLYFKMQYRRGGYGMSQVVPGGFVPASRHLYWYLPRLRRLRDRRLLEYDVYGRFGLQFAGSLRREAIAQLSQSDRFRFQGGNRLPRYSSYLLEIARAKVCVNLPGNGELCFRLLDYFAVGACVVGPRPRTELHIPPVDRVHIRYTRDDLSDLVDLCAYYVEHEDAREAMCRQARAFFDSYLHMDRLAAYYLSRIATALGVPPSSPQPAAATGSIP